MLLLSACATRSNPRMNVIGRPPGCAPKEPIKLDAETCWISVTSTQPDKIPEFTRVMEKVVNEMDCFFCETAAYDFDGEDEIDLTFKAGDTISVTEIVDKNWFRGFVRGDASNTTRHFPKTYLKSFSPEKNINV